MEKDKSLVDKNPAPLGWDNMFDNDLLNIMLGEGTWEYYQAMSRVALPIFNQSSLNRNAEADIKTGADNLKPLKKKK
jgi:hypothetical protein